jgi:hypothetical protein
MPSLFDTNAGPVGIYINFQAVIAKRVARKVLNGIALVIP